MSDKKDQTEAPAEVTEDDLDQAQGGAMRLTSKAQKAQKVRATDAASAVESKLRSNQAIP